VHQYWQGYYTYIGEISIVHLKCKIMGNILYILAVILIIGWLLGMFAFNVGGGLIHLLLVIAVIAIVINLIGGRRTRI
jgi:Family of unknown function (DUF5670)